MCVNPHAVDETRLKKEEISETLKLVRAGNPKDVKFYFQLSFFFFALLDANAAAPAAEEVLMFEVTPTSGGGSQGSLGSSAPGPDQPVPRFSS